MNIKRTIISGICFSLGLIPAAMAQTPSEEINDQKIMDKVERSVQALAKRNPAYGVAHLVKNCSRSLKDAEVTKQFARLRKGTTKLSSEEIFAKRIKGTLIFGNYFNCGQCDQLHTGIGTTAIALTPDGVCATNYHVMEDIIRNNQKELSGDSLFYVGTVDGKAYPVVKVLAYSRINDAAIFQVDTQGDKLDCIPLGDTALTGSKVHLISHPKEMLWVYTEGVVAKNQEYTQENLPPQYRMHVTCDYAVGSSGGPLMDDYGNLVGMVASTTGLYYNQEHKTDLQMVLKSTIPVKVIKELLKLNNK